VYLGTTHADTTLADGTHVYALRNPITVPGRHTLKVRLLHAWLSHNNYSIFQDNDALVPRYDDGGEERAPDLTVRLPHGDQWVDDDVAILNDGRLHDYVASYDLFTKRRTLEGTYDAEAVLVVQPGTTCGSLFGLGVCERATVSDDFRLALIAGHVVDLTRTSCAFVHNNLLTQNRDPRWRRVGEISARIPLNADCNENDHYSANAFVSV
jgi:hypothetical protein